MVKKGQNLVKVVKECPLSIHVSNAAAIPRGFFFRFLCLPVKKDNENKIIENISSERVPLYCGTLIPWQRQKLHLGTYYNYTVLVHLLSTYMIYSAYIHNMYLGLSVVYVHIYKWTMNAH